MKHNLIICFWRRAKWMYALPLMCLAATLPCNDLLAQDSIEEAVGTADVPGETATVDRPEEAGESVAAEDIGPSTVVDPWDLFFPPRDSKFDWIQLKSGEWLKGKLKGLYSYKVEFESDELDNLDFDWEDIKSIRTASAVEVGYDPYGDTEAGLLRFTRRQQPHVAFGQLTLIGDTATVGTGPDALQIKRDQIATVAKGTQKEADFWSGEFSFGANARRGNSDTSDANLYMQAQRRRAINRFYADYRANFSKAGEDELSNNHRIKSWFDSFRTSRLYWRILYAEYFRDRFQNIENQLSLGSGLGYDIIRTKRTEWDVSAGVGALYKEATSVLANQDAANTSSAFTLATKLDIELTNRVDFLLNYSATFVDDDNGKYIHNAVTTLSSDITGNLDLDITVVWDHVAKPQRAEDGTLPEKDDYRFGVAISYEF